MGNIFADYEKKNGISRSSKSTGNIYADYEIAHGIITPDEYKQPSPAPTTIEEAFSQVTGNKPLMKNPTAPSEVNKVVTKAKKLPKVKSQLESDHEFRMKAINDPNTNILLKSWLKLIDPIVSNPTYDAFSTRSGVAAMNAMGGEPQTAPSTGNAFADAGADALGMIGGFMAPGAGMATGVENTVGNLAGRYLPKLAVSKLGSRLATGAAGGAAYEGALGAANDEKPGQIAKNTLTGAATFGAMKGAGALGRLPAAAAGAGVFGGQSLLSGASPQEALAQALFGGVMGAMGGEKRTRNGPTFVEPVEALPALESGNRVKGLLPEPKPTDWYMGQSGVSPDINEAGKMIGRLGSGIKTGEGTVNPAYRLNANNERTILVDGQATPVKNLGVPRSPDYYVGDLGASPDIEVAGRKGLPGGEQPLQLPDRFVKGSPDFFGSETGTVSRNPEVTALYDQIKPSVTAQIEKMYVPGVKPAASFVSKVVNQTAKDATPGQKAELVRIFTQMERPKAEPLQAEPAKNISAVDYKGELKGYNDLKQARDEMQAELDKATEQEAQWQYEMQKGVGANDLWQRIKANGGIKPYKNNYLAEEYKGLNNYVKNKNGLTMDEMADTLGYPSESDFVADLQKQEAAHKETLANIRGNVDLYNTNPKYKAMADTITKFDQMLKDTGKNVNPNDLAKVNQTLDNSNQPLVKANPTIEKTIPTEPAQQTTSVLPPAKEEVIPAKMTDPTINQVQNPAEPDIRPYTVKNNLDFEVGDSVYGPGGKPSKVVDNSDPAKVVIKTNDGTELQVGRKGLAKLQGQYQTTSADQEIAAGKAPQSNDNVNVTSSLDKMEASARDRIAKRKGQLNANPIPDWADHAIIGAAKIARGLKRFPEWAKEMLSEFGDSIKSKLQWIWNEARTIHQKYSKINPEPKAADPNRMKDDAEGFRAKVNRNPKKEPGRLSDLYTKLRSQFVDDLAPAHDIEKAILGEIPSAERSLYKQARNFRGSAEKAHVLLKNKLNPILQKADDLGIKQDDLGDYMAAVHAKDIDALGEKMTREAEDKLMEGIAFNDMVRDMLRKGEAVKGQYKMADIGKLKADLKAAQKFRSGFTPGQINDVIRKYGTKETESVRKEILQYSNDLLNGYASSGRISAKDVADMRTKFPNYTPFLRYFDDAKVDFETQLSNAIANPGTPIHKFTGSERDIIDPLEGIVKNTFKLTQAADKNNVMRQLERLATADTKGNFVRKLNPGEEVGRKNVLKAFREGKEVQYEVDPDLYRSLKDLDKESADTIIKILSVPAKILRAGATLTPEFSMRNPTRDVLHAYIVSKSGFTPVDFLVGLAHVVGQGKELKVGGKSLKLPGDLYKEFVQNNGGYGNIISMDRNLHRKALENAIKKPVSQKFVSVINPKTYLEVLRSISDATETATKLGEYRAAKRSGTTKQEAAYRARDIMDFSRAGSSIRNWNRVVAFLNSSIQGKSKTFRALKENPKGVTTRALLSITVPTLGVFLAQQYLANDEQKTRINDAPEWLKSNFWLVPIPKTDLVARIPKPFEWAPAFANLPEKFLDYMVKNDKDAFDGFARESLKAYSIPTMLTGLTPIVEGMMNYSLFREAPIIPVREQKLNYRDQYDVNTTETAKFLAKGMEKLTGGEGSFKNFSSPRVMDNTIQGTTAGLGKLVTGGIDALVRSNEVQRPGKTLSQQPVLRAFFVNDMSTGQAMDDLYTLNEKLTKDSNSAKDNHTYFAKKSDLKYANKMTEKIGKITKHMRAIQNSSTLNAETKKAQLIQLNNHRNDLARQAMVRLKRED